MIAAPQVALANPLHGAWCNDDGTMFVDEFGLGFNDHTVCDVDPLPALRDGRYAARITCNNMRQVSEMDAIAVPVPVPDVTDIEIEMLSDTQLRMALNTYPDGVMLERCD